MKNNNTMIRRASAGALLGVAAAALVTAPTAAAAPNCSPDAVAGTVSSVTRTVLRWRPSEEHKEAAE